jgi:hypothetical protein
MHYLKAWIESKPQERRVYTLNRKFLPWIENYPRTGDKFWSEDLSGTKFGPRKTVARGEQEVELAARFFFGTTYQNGGIYTKYQ